MVAMAISELYAKYFFFAIEFPIDIYRQSFWRGKAPPMRTLGGGDCPCPPAPPPLGTRSLVVDRLAHRPVSPVGEGIELRRLLLLPLSVKPW